MESFVIIGFLHTMHKEMDQSISILTFDEKHPWGVQGRDFDPSYFVTTEPVYLKSKDIEEVKQ